MLSRIAESLYWIGRYLERAEDTSRLLDVQLHLSVEDPVIDARASADRLLTVMGIDHEGPASEDLVLRRLCHDPDSPASIVSALKGARESARRSRETVSTEMWEAINTTWYAVQRGELAKVRPALAFRWVRERCAVITATADGTMSHDQGWYFLVLGRSLERIDMTARLAASAATGPAATAWSSTLRACGATTPSCAATTTRTPTVRPLSSSCWTGSSRARSSTPSTPPWMPSIGSPRPSVAA